MRHTNNQARSGLARVRQRADVRPHLGRHLSEGGGDVLERRGRGVELGVVEEQVGLQLERIWKRRRMTTCEKAETEVAAALQNGVLGGWTYSGLCAGSSGLVFGYTRP